MTFFKGNIPWNFGMKGYTNKGSFKKGHKSISFWKGKNLSEAHKQKIRKNMPDQLGKDNPNWKGDAVGPRGLRARKSRMKSRRPCEECNGCGNCDWYREQQKEKYENEKYEDS